jgi:ParB/RepB/Spo0J family partition protein
MAKRKRLTPLGMTDAPPMLETKAFFSSNPPGHAAPRAAPIADMAGAAAATAAMEELAETLRQISEEGRMVLSLPLEQVQADYLIRDRLVLDDEEMSALVESLRIRGQQTPVEVTDLGAKRYGLISGWRRLAALKQLHDETGDAKFGSVLALVRQPRQSADAYLAMVEENEIRAGLSFYERARIVARAGEAGAYEDDRAALRGLFGAVPRARRSKIGSFLAVVRALDGVLRFPGAISERLGLRLAQALETDPGLGARIRADLEAQPAGDAAAETARLLRALAMEKQSRSAGAETSEPLPGLRIRVQKGRLVLEGPRVDAALRARLEDWLRTLDEEM